MKNQNTVAACVRPTDRTVHQPRRERIGLRIYVNAVFTKRDKRWEWFLAALHRRRCHRCLIGTLCTIIYCVLLPARECVCVCALSWYCRNASHICGYLTSMVNRCLSVHTNGNISVRRPRTIWQFWSQWKYLYLYRARRMCDKLVVLAALPQHIIGEKNRNENPNFYRPRITIIALYAFDTNKWRAKSIHWADLFTLTVHWNMIS